MVSFEVTCVKKTRRANPDERIIHVGGGSGELYWRFAQHDAIEEIESGKWSFYLRLQGAIAKVVVARSELGKKYLKTQADGVQPGQPAGAA